MERTRHHSRLSQFSSAYGKVLLEQVYPTLRNIARLNDFTPVNTVTQILDAECPELRPYGRLEMKAAALLMSSGKMDSAITGTPKPFWDLLHAMASSAEPRQLPSGEDAARIMRVCQDLINSPNEADSKV